MVAKLKNLLQNEIAKVDSTKPFGVLFSGGVDSSTIAKLIDQMDLSNQHCLFSLTSENSKDKSFTHLWSKFLNPDRWEMIAVKIPNGKELENCKESVVNVLSKTFSKNNQYNNKIFHLPGILANMQISLASGYYLLCQEAKSRGVREIFTGQGSDELFAGYSKFKKNPPDLLELTKKEYDRLLAVDVKRDNAVAKQLGIKFYAPFSAKKIANFAFGLPNKWKLSSTSNKIIVRELACSIGIPKEIYERPKKAFQYSSGIQKALKKL